MFSSTFKKLIGTGKISMELRKEYFALYTKNKVITIRLSEKVLKNVNGLE